MSVRDDGARHPGRLHRRISSLSSPHKPAVRDRARPVVGFGIIQEHHGQIRVESEPARHDVQDRLSLSRPHSRRPKRAGRPAGAPGRVDFLCDGPPGCGPVVSGGDPRPTSSILPRAGPREAKGEYPDPFRRLLVSPRASAAVEQNAVAGRKETRMPKQGSQAPDPRAHAADRRVLHRPRDPESSRKSSRNGTPTHARARSARSEERLPRHRGRAARATGPSISLACRVRHAGRDDATPIEAKTGCRWERWVRALAHAGGVCA